MRLLALVYCLLTVFSISQCALLGFDYGEEFSKAMLVSPHAPLELVLTADSKRKDVSGLALKKWRSDIERVFGSGIASSQVKTPNGALLHVKSLLGKQIDGTFSHYHKCHPGVVFQPTPRDTVALEGLGYRYSVEEVLAMNLEETIARANALLRYDKSITDRVDSIAITVPEYFTQGQRHALLTTAELPAGVRAHLVNDGLTVAIDFAVKQRNFPAGEKQHFILYDMGSGSTRVSLISIEQPINISEPLILDFIGYGYDAGLGGSHFTSNVADILKNKFLEQNPSVRTSSLEKNSRAMVRLQQAAEKAKLILSANADASVNIESLYNDLDFKTSITRQEFEEFCEDLIVRINAPIFEALENQFLERVDLKDIKSLILTGGASRTPMVQKQLSDYFGEDVVAKNVNADESSVNGATLRGIQLFKSFQTKPLEVVDRSIYSYGVVINESSAPAEIFGRGSQYPNLTSYLIPPQSNLSHFSIDLREDDMIFKSHIVDTDPISSKFSPEKCPLGVAYNLTFTLSQGRIFDLDAIEAICGQNSDSTDGIFKKRFAGGDLSSESPNEDGEPVDSGVDRVKKLKTKAIFPKVAPMSTSERLTIKKHMETMSQKDAQRLKIEELVNTLESTLYDTRAYLENENVSSEGPSETLETLSNLVGEYLDWLDYEADDASIEILDRKIKTIVELRERVVLYLSSSGEPLDYDQFLQLYGTGLDLIKSFENSQQVENTTLEALRDSFSDVELDVVKEFKKIKAPRHLALPAYKLKEAKESMEKIIASINAILDPSLMSISPRENLVSLKLQFDDAFSDLKKYWEIDEGIQKFRLNELSSLYSRRLRVIKKREERKKSQEMTSLQDSNFTSGTDNQMSSTSSNPQESSSTTLLEHDEL
ncbi:LADA_0D09362g1_1 [Lachancea dasiensis]|uniref:LADA_0D09362g1_1 n=1 Tax=Lachancea dasiensis TaxID=1072105 RepID=A0A1G4J797_9SACH|nr:LADA_0D09362g1_1 [Lachancea dasiensis]